MATYRTPILQDFNWQPNIDDRVTNPAETEAKGTRYIVIATGSGIFTGKENQVMTANQANPTLIGHWIEDTPAEGWQCWVEDENTYYVFDGTNWVNSIGGIYQAQGDVLDDLNTLGANAADSEFLVGTGAGALAWESGATARTSIGLGTGDSPQIAALKLGTANLKTGALFELAEDAVNAELAISCYHDTEATTPLITLRKADGSEASPALVDSGAILGTINFDGYDGSGWHTGARIMAQATSTPSDGTDMPAVLIFYTTPDNSATPTLAMLINKLQNVGIGEDNPDIRLHVKAVTTIAKFETTGTQNCQLQFADSGGVTWTIGTDVNNINNEKFQFYHAGCAFALTILASGNVGINDIAPAEKLDVDGNINATGVYKVDDVQVVKEQQVHITDAPGDTAANNATTINAILAMLETHGLIANA